MRSMVEIDEQMERWLNDVKDSTAHQYKYSFDKFKNFFNISALELLELAKEDKIKVKDMLNKFYKHHRRQEYSHNYSAIVESAIKSFLNFYELPVKTKPRKTPRKYSRRALRKEHVRKMVDAAPFLRDKALICMGFQSGMAISDLLALNYKNIKHALELQQNLFVIRYIRRKSETKSLAIIGHDSLLLLRQYISWRRERGDLLIDPSPLFVRVHKNNTATEEEKRLSTRNAQVMMRKTGVKAGLITFAELNEYVKFNPIGFHALRKAFSTVTELAGMPKTQIEYSVGHVLDYDGAYKEFTTEEMLQNYKDVEKELSIFTDENEIKELQEEVAQQKIEITDHKTFIEDMREFMSAFPEFRKVVKLWEEKKDKIIQMLGPQQP